ncbi:MAG TPA: hypothetical protein VGF53_15465 [Pseudolabrys sp.]
MGAASVAAALLLLAGCAWDPYVYGGKKLTVGRWLIEQQTDRITGAPISNAQVRSTTVSNGGIGLPPPARMQLLCFKEQPAVLIVFEFKIGSTRNAELGYRFDDKPGHQPTVRIVEGYKSVVIEDTAEVTRFVNEMATSNALYVRIRALNALRTSAEFPVDSAPAAIAAAYATCPLDGAKRTSALPPDARAEKDD